MAKKLLGVLLACISVLFVACGAYWEDKGIFSEIEKEIKLEKPDVIGNILSILEYNGELFAGGGVIYHKGIDAVRGWSKFSSAPYGQVIRLAAGYSSSSEWLYALCAGRETDDNEIFKLYCRKSGSGWQQVSPAGTIITIFSNNAVSVTDPADATQNRAFVTTSTGIYELQGASTPLAVTVVDTTNGALASSKGAAYISSSSGGTASGTHFSDNPAFTSDGTYLFTADQLGISDITSIGACDNVLYIGTKSGPKQVDINIGMVGAISDIVGENAEATFSGYANGAVYARSSSGRTDIYISAIGRGSTFASKNNGLWGYYSDRGNWNRE
jgi:hypothetical protein